MCVGKALIGESVPATAMYPLLVYLSIPTMSGNLAGLDSYSSTKEFDGLINACIRLLNDNRG